jgi:hypothetical protein
VAVGEQPLERDRPRGRAVVEEQVDGPARRQRAAVGAAGVDRLGPPRAARRAPRLGLVRREHRERDALGGERVERRQVDRALGQPHALRRAAEPALEVGDAPPHLGRAIARRGQRHDQVVVGLGHRRAVAAEPRTARAIGGDHRLVDVGRIVLEPRQQGRPDVEAHPLVVIDDRDDLVVVVDDAGRGVGPVALGGDPVVPVAVRVRGRLGLHRLQPRVLARRLVEVAMDADPPVRRLAHDSAVNTTMPSGGAVTTSECSRPRHGTGSASSPPRLPIPLPP